MRDCENEGDFCISVHTRMHRLATEQNNNILELFLSINYKILAPYEKDRVVVITSHHRRGTGYDKKNTRK